MLKSRQNAKDLDPSRSELERRCRCANSSVILDACVRWWLRIRLGRSCAMPGCICCSTLGCYTTDCQKGFGPVRLAGAYAEGGDVQGQFRQQQDNISELQVSIRGAR
jgi:hypothetical protein